MQTRPENTPLCVVMPIYNAGDFLHAAVHSVAAQSFSDFECLLCDASDDGSSDFLQNLVKQDPRFTLIRQKKSSLGQALQEGVALARAPLVARLDADDIALPHRFMVQMQEMQKRPELLALGSAIQYIDGTGRLGRVASHPPEKDIPRELLWGCPLAHTTVMFRRQAVLDVGGYRSLFRYWEDYDLWLRLSRLGALDNLEQVLVYYRMHGGNSVSAQALPGRRYAVNAQAAYHIARQTGRDPLDGLTELPAVEDIVSALSRDEQVSLLGRILACTAHFLGDYEEDEEGRPWLAQIQAAPLTAELREILGTYHMRCAKRYIKQAPLRAMKHLGTALRYDHKAALTMILRLIQQHGRAFFTTPARRK